LNWGAAPAAAFVMPIFAAVDIGSNSVRLKIARLQGRRLRALHEDREVTRMGESVFRTGFLSPDAMANTIKVLRRFHRVAQRHLAFSRPMPWPTRSRCFAGFIVWHKGWVPIQSGWSRPAPCVMPAIPARFWNGCARRR